MADPLSVAASVVGLIVAASQITKVITSVIKRVKHVPRQLQETRTEVDDVKRILEQLQAFLMKYSRVSRSRSSLILVDQVIVTLASCVTTFSELDTFVVVLDSEKDLTLFDRIRWGRKIEPLSDILHRLQLHKQSLSLMLIILTGDSQLEAESKVEQLIELYEKSLIMFQVIASRMQDFTGSGSIPVAPQSAILVPPEIAQDGRLPPNTSIVRSSAGFAFEEILLNSRAYRHASDNADIDGTFSIASSAGRTGSWTMLSGLSLSDMSHIGILALPIYPNDIENPQCYELDSTAYTEILRNESHSSMKASEMHSAVVSSSPRGWWKKFSFRDTASTAANAEPKSTVGGQMIRTPLVESIRYANVVITITNDKGEAFNYGYIPVIVGKCGVFLKEKATSVENIFATSGHPVRLEKLVQDFSARPGYGKGMHWSGYTVHDAAGVLLRYLKTMDEPILPYNCYDSFTKPLRQHHGVPGNPVSGGSDHGPDPGDDRHIRMFQATIYSLPPLNRQLFLYILDLLAVFASRSDVNKMTTVKLAATFQPAILSLSPEQMTPEESHLALETVVYLVDHQDHFLIGMDVLTE